MTGPEHYQEAEAYLDDTVELIADGTTDDGYLQQKLMLAQAHATLALAAATAISHLKSTPYDDVEAWLDAAAVCRQKTED